MHTDHNCFSPKDVTTYYKDQKSHLRSSSLWTDELFPPNIESLMSINKSGKFIDPIAGSENAQDIDSNNIEWKRASEIFGNNSKVFDKIEFDDIKQGQLGNCYFLSAIAAMAEFPSLIEDIFKTKEINPRGYYEVALFIDGTWQIVVVDDYFPVMSRSKRLAFTQTNGNELWVLILEKAWAKVNGGYVNIIGGISSDPFSALTSFPCSYIAHKDVDVNELWEKILASESANDVMCTATDADDNKQSRVGLVPGHAYTVISARSAIHNGNKIRLLRIRNPWGQKEWNGNWSDKSRIWNAELKAKFDYHDSDDGAFWMSIEDFVKYFDSTSFCHILYHSHVKHFTINQDQLKSPSVYNLYLKEDSKVSLSVFRKHWRYNREFRDKNQPISLVIANYDTNNKLLRNVNGSFSSVDNAEYTANFTKGHYVVWVYYALDASDLPRLDKCVLRVASDSDFNIEQNKPDTEFKLIREIIIAGCRELYAEEIISKPSYLKIENGFKDTGIGFLFASNSTSQKLQIVAEINNVTNFHNLHPHTKDAKVSIGVNPGGVHAILAIRKCTFGSYGYTISISYGSRPKDGVGLKSLADVSEYLPDLTNKKNTYDYNFDVEHKCHSHDDSEKDKPNNSGKENPNNSVNDKQNNVPDKKPEIEEPAPKVVDETNDIITLNLRKKFPELMEKLFKLPKSLHDDELSWTNLKWGNNYYVGQTDKDHNITGRGAFVIPEELTYISQWVNGVKNGFGQVLDSDNRLVYEGNFENDNFNGNGKLFQPNGDRYEGMFNNGRFTGKGTYYWKDGSKWDGTFFENKFHGKGTQTDVRGNKEEVEYQNGKKVDNRKKERESIRNPERNSIFDSNFRNPGFNNFSNFDQFFGNDCKTIKINNNGDFDEFEDFDNFDFDNYEFEEVDNDYY